MSLYVGKLFVAIYVSGFTLFHVFIFEHFNIVEVYNEKFSLRFVSPNSHNLYILGLRATKILIRSMIYFALFTFYAWILH